MNTQESEQEILEVIRQMLVDVAGDELLLDEPIGMETSFNEDLELESIEFVQLAEQVQMRYGGSVDFAGWISGKDLDEIIGLKVGDLVRFIASCRT
ncbi:acyl carrier protein [Elongatibacter sediminis]|uniref:Acyl carrier protein n=1 Tax=Elongatibacter sediminis TaxID=3119006 RepID=A0AAW9R9H3_9GAMM